MPDNVAAEKSKAYTLDAAELKGYEKLIYYNEKGFVFHGSIHGDILILKPQAPHDAGKDPWNKDAAVYAANEPVYAVIFALRKGYRGVFSVGAYKGGKVTACFGKGFEDQLSQNHGYVYVLRADYFSKHKGHQCKSETEVEPTDIIEVTLSDYINLGGELNFV